MATAPLTRHPHRRLGGGAPAIGERSSCEPKTGLARGEDPVPGGSVLWWAAMGPGGPESQIVEGHRSRRSPPAEHPCTSTTWVGTAALEALPVACRARCRLIGCRGYEARPAPRRRVERWRHRSWVCRPFASHSMLARVIRASSSRRSRTDDQATGAEPAAMPQHGCTAHAALRAFLARGRSGPARTTRPHGERAPGRAPGRMLSHSRAMRRAGPWDPAPRRDEHDGVWHLLCRPRPRSS